MRVLLAGPDHEENLSIRYLSASLLDAGHETFLATFNSPADIPSVAEAAQQADIVGLSMCFQSRAHEFLRLAQLIKSQNPKQLVVAGGHYASCAAEPLLANHPEIDIIVIHEGEGTLVELADAQPHLKDRLPQIPGIAYRDEQQVHFTTPRRTLDDLDMLPFPDRRGPIHVIAGVPTSYIMGSRGCYGNCAYCCITTLHRMAPGKRFRQRRAERVADEMAALYHERGTRQFIFHDDNFLVPSESTNHAQITALKKALKHRGIDDIALVVKCRPADANRRVLERLKELGLVRVFLGVESTTTRGLSALERIQSVEDSERALAICAELDISAQFTIMIFQPDATLETMRSDAAFMRRYCGNPLNFCRAEIYAGTPLEQRMLQLGRAKGDYLARVYNLSDPVADLACNISLDLFVSRCWGNGSLMQNAIGLDHNAAVVKRFYAGAPGPALSRRIGRWLRSVNSDTIDLLEEVIELSASRDGTRDAGVKRAILALQDRESSARREFLSEAARLRSELEALRFPNNLIRVRVNQVPGSHLRLATQVAAAVLAIGIPATSLPSTALGREVKTPPASSQVQANSGSVTGTITDPTGAVIATAQIDIHNIDTGKVRTLGTDQTGRYLANDLPAGRYSIHVSYPGFKSAEKTGIVLKPGDRERADFVLQISTSDIGCCEYAAAPLHTPDWTAKKKPFTYTQGEADDQNSFQGIAKLVYGDSRLWVQIFEANRKEFEKPGFIPYNASILIPPRKRPIPKLISRVAAVYPPAAQKEDVSGDVVMDVTLRPDGTVEWVNVVDGHPSLIQAAVDAVKQWRYQPLTAKNKSLMRNFVVVVSFGKRGKVQYQ